MIPWMLVHSSLSHRDTEFIYICINQKTNANPVYAEFVLGHLGKQAGMHAHWRGSSGAAGE